jgi:hypothetical protein
VIILYVNITEYKLNAEFAIEFKPIMSSSSTTSKPIKLTFFISIPSKFKGFIGALFTSESTRPSYEKLLTACPISGTDLCCVINP